MTDDSSVKDPKEVNRPIPCPDCEHGELEVSDAVFADCDTCDAAVLRIEVGV